MKRLKYGKYPDEYVNTLYQQHIDGKSISEIARSINKDPSTINKLFSSRKLKIIDRPYCEVYKKYTYDKTYFDKIDTHEKAYILGFLYADGWVIKKSENCYTLGICLKREDRYMIEFIKNSLKYNGIINDSYDKTRKKYKSGINIYSNELSKSLINLGMLPKKSSIDFKMPEIDKKYINSFIYGYFDGDGTIYKFKNKYNSEYIGISICSPTYNILSNFKDYLLYNNIYSNIICDKRNHRNNKYKNMYNLTICRQKEVLKFINLITKDFNKGLIRKLEKINYANTVLNSKFNKLESV